MTLRRYGAAKVSTTSKFSASANNFRAVARQKVSVNILVAGELPLPPSTVEYLVVAGGGSGAVGNSGNIGNGGGGAGGYKTAAGLSIAGGILYTVIVGAGGTSPGTNTLGALGLNGSDSSLSGSGLTTITSLGGGSARAYRTAAGSSSNGGSGGGGAWNNISAGLGTAGQGYDGGAGPNAGGANGGGGGGGAGAVGFNGSSASGGAGGVGLSSSISGSEIFYAGGGGGGRGGAGGNGGGGRGGGIGSGSSNAKGTNGDVNTGGGGGGTAGTTSGSGNGGSGIVIIRYPDIYAAATSTTGVEAGYPVVSGGYRIYKWTSSGSITF